MVLVGNKVFHLKLLSYRQDPRLTQGMKLTRSDVLAVTHQHPKPISSTHKVKRESERETYVSLRGDDLICMQEMSLHVCAS